MATSSDVQFASLLASRLCHDLINPAGALNTGLDVLSTEKDGEMRQHAEALVSDSTARLLAIIDYARTAYGASGGSEGELGTEEIGRLAKSLYKHLKPELQWQIGTPALPKLEGRALMNLLLVCERMVPRNGSSVLVEGSAGSLSITASGPKARMPEDLAAAFAGEDQAMEPKVMPAILAQKLAADAGRTITTEVGEEVVLVRLG
jgi:histidine phosphotransferase ChpT